MKKNKQLLSEVRRMQQLAGIRPLNEFEDLNGEFEDLNGDRLYDKPNLDVGKIGVYEAELEDMFMQYAEQYGESDALEGSEADHLPMLEDELGRKLPLIFTFVIQGDNSDKDSVYDLGDGENVIYEEGYDGMIQAYSKKTLAKVIRELKSMGAKPYQEGMEEASGMDMDQAVAEGGNLIGNDRDTEVKLSIAIDNALEAGKEVTIQGAPVEMSGNHAAIMSDGSHIRWQNISLDDVLVDGQPIDISTAKAAPKDSQSFADRFGPGGGQNTAMGRRTFD